MKVILDQNEIFQAITDFVRSKWRLEDAATVEINLTAGRSPRGYSADVEITYPSAQPSNLTTRVSEEPSNETAQEEGAAVPANTAASLTSATGVKMGSGDLLD